MEQIQTNDNSKVFRIIAAVGFFLAGAMSLYFTGSNIVSFIRNIGSYGLSYSFFEVFWVLLYFLIAAGSVFTGVFLIAKLNRIMGGIGVAAITVGYLIAMLMQIRYMIIYVGNTYLGWMFGYLAFGAAAAVLAVALFMGNKELFEKLKFLVMAFAALAFVILLVRYITYWNEYFRTDYYTSTPFLSLYGTNIVANLGLVVGFVFASMYISKLADSIFSNAQKPAAMYKPATAVFTPESPAQAAPAQPVNAAPVQAAPVQTVAPAQPAAPAVAEAPTCANCGAALSSTAKFCKNCGTPVSR